MMHFSWVLKLPRHQILLMLSGGFFRCLPKILFINFNRAASSFHSFPIFIFYILYFLLWNFKLRITAVNYILRGKVAGLVSLVASVRTSMGKTIFSVPHEIQVFNSLLSFPKIITLIPESTFQVRPLYILPLIFI